MAEKYEYLPIEVQEKAMRAGPELSSRPTKRVVITGHAGYSPLGDQNETFKAMLEGKSGITKYSVDNFRSNVGGLLDFNIDELYPTDRDKKRTSRVAAMAEILTMRAAEQSRMLGSDGLILPSIGAENVGVWIGSGIGPVQEIVSIQNTINSVVDSNLQLKEDLAKFNIFSEEYLNKMAQINGTVNKRAGSKKVDPYVGLRIFPQDVAARPAMRIGAQGFSGSTVEACATGASNIVVAYKSIRNGEASIIAAGGVEDPLHVHGETTMGIFGSMRVLSANEDPEEASRPYDEARDGFVASSGGTVLILESLESALERGAPIYGEILGAAKTIDGNKNEPTSLIPANVARTIRYSLTDYENGKMYTPDGILAHATSTPQGDPLEKEAFEIALNDYLPYIPITAIKSYLGHSLGDTGAKATQTALQMIDSGFAPAIRNLKNPGPEFGRLNLIRNEPLKKLFNTVLVVSYGFGGFNSSILLGKFKG